MRSIVVPVDFTRNSANAARYAADLALAIGAEIHLINVCSTPDTKVLDTLSAEITRHNPFLVVMGASGDSVQNIFEGSLTVKALRRLRYPLLVIPEDARFHPVEKILLACDTEDIVSGMPSTLPFLKELSELLGAHLEVVRVLTTSEDSVLGDLHDYDVWKSQVKALCPYLRFVRRPSVLEGITTFLKGNPADWLMVFPKSHSLLEFHRSRAKRIMLHCPIPVLSVHE